MFKLQPLTFYLKLSLSLIFFIILGLFSKFYQGTGHQWLNDDANGIFYVVCWALSFALLCPKKTIKYWVISALVLSSSLEFLQLSQAPFLLELRSYLLGRLILGSYFSWLDFPYYSLGAILAWRWLVHLQLKPRLI